ncbi:UNVERIFIED_ORG: hypothetical protein FHR35_001756 [Microbispora rosea subsp. rosea]
MTRHTHEDSENALCAFDLADEMVEYLIQAYNYCRDDSYDAYHLDIAIYCAMTRAEEDIPNAITPGSFVAPLGAVRKGALTPPTRCEYIETCGDVLQTYELKHLAEGLNNIRERLWEGINEKSLPPLAEALRLHLQIAIETAQGFRAELWRREALAKPQQLSQPIQRPNPCVAPSALHLVDQVVRILPQEYRDRYQEEFRAEIHELAQAKATKTLQIIYVAQQLRHVWQLRNALQAPDSPRMRRLHQVACWILASDWRTWGLLAPLMILGIVNVHLQQGWGSALFTLPGVVTFYAGVEWLRKHWNVRVKGHEDSEKANLEDD